MPHPDDEVLVNIAQSLQKNAGIFARQDTPLRPDRRATVEADGEL